MTPLYKEYRCPTDHKLLFKGIIVDAEIEIKCKSCKQMITIAPTPIREILCTREKCERRISSQTISRTIDGIPHEFCNG